MHITAFIIFLSKGYGEGTRFTVCQKQMNQNEIKKTSIKKWIWFIGIILLIYLASKLLDIDAGYFFKRADHLTDIVSKMFPPEWDYISKIIEPVISTLQMSVAGTVMGSFFALLFAPLCANVVGFPVWIRGILKLIIQVMRSFPALILALSATFVFGLGTFAGTAALTVYTFAIMTRLTYEDAESMGQRTYMAIRNMGVGRYKAFMRGILPDILPSYLTNALYMLESNVRQSAILGYVGAGGIGLMINEKVSWREYGKVGMILILLYVVVCAIEGLSQFLTEVVRNEKKLPKNGKKLIVIVLTVIFLYCIIMQSPPDFSHTSLTVIKNMLMGFVCPDFSFITDMSTSGLLYLLLETVCISFLGTLLGAVISIPLSLLNTSKLMPRPISLIFRLAVMAVRAVPFVIYGIIFVRVTGQGAFTGVLTMTVCSIGLLTKRFTQSIDALDLRSYNALRSMGITSFKRIRYCLLPQLGPQFASVILYRFDVNIREASVLGLVGAGGIGTPLIFAMNHYDWATAGAISWGLIMIVWVIDFCSVRLRSRLQ